MVTDSGRFSNVTKNYLTRFYEILDEMICKMTSAELTNSISHNFIVQMIPHHMAAIEMSHNILQYTIVVPLQNIAENIIEEQTKSIADMSAALNCCDEFQNTEQELCLYTRRFHQVTQTMFTNMGDACATNNVSANFIREMIPHHRGAIQMSENTLRFSICPELLPIIQAIIISQQAGIQEMERLLRCI